LTTKTVDYLSKSDRTCSQIDEFIETSKAIESKLQEQTLISSYELLKLQHEAEILREQVESLKQELKEKDRLIELYRQEQLQANSEIDNLNWELQDIFAIENLKLDTAKRLALNILRCRRFTSESLAKLISAMSCVVVTAEELDAIANESEQAFDVHGEDAA
jgi:hypothetical protein